MEKYNYMEVLKLDIKNYLEEEKITVTSGNRMELESQLFDDLWTNDSVTGNGSGSYFCNAWKAGEALLGNWDLLQDALECFDITDNPIKKGEEWCDVMIRCYLLTSAISYVLDEKEEEEDEE